MPVSVGTPAGPMPTTCGYCSPPGTRSITKSAAHAAGLSAHQLSCEIYQKMIDRGWRRSGTWCYKPNLEASCCPSYTIKLDAENFKPSKSQRKLIHRWNRFICKESQSKPPPSKSKHTPFSLSNDIHAPEVGFCSNERPEHRFETILEPSSYSPEKFELYCKYQRDIHNDSENTSSGFKRFLVNSPLLPAPIPYSSPPPPHLPTNYGSYHQLYKCDGKLIALGVIDILPSCVSSVYFMYDPEWEKFSLGKLSALREVSLASEIKASGAPGMTSLYMGFYIYSCPKMRYKGDYSPSYLADPETYAWFPLESCIPLLERYRYACFSRPDHSTVEPFDHDTLALPMDDPPDDLLSKVFLVRGIENNRITIIPVNESPYWDDDDVRRDIVGCISGLGEELATEIIFYLDG